MGKFGINRIKIEARNRKIKIKKELDRRKNKRIEDEYWKDDNKKLERKLRKQEKLIEKQENKIRYNKLKRDQMKEEYLKILWPKEQKTNTIEVQETSENIKNQEKFVLKKNLDDLEGAELDYVLIKEFKHLIRIKKSKKLDISNEEIDIKKEDIHPEKRIKKLYKNYREINYFRVRKENPNLKYSQYNDILWEEFKNSDIWPMKPIIKL